MVASPARRQPESLLSDPYCPRREAHVEQQVVTVATGEVVVGVDVQGQFRARPRLSGACSYPAPSAERVPTRVNASRSGIAVPPSFGKCESISYTYHLAAQYHLQVYCASYDECV